MIFTIIEWLRGWLMPYPFWLPDLGQRGEYLARRYFHRQGYFCLERNWRHGKGEVDLIMANYKRLVFVEVKARTHRDDLQIYEVVSHEQAKRLMKLAHRFLRQYGEQEIPWRFKVVLLSFQKRRFQIEEMELDTRG